MTIKGLAAILKYYKNNKGEVLIEGLDGFVVAKLCGINNHGLWLSCTGPEEEGKGGGMRNKLWVVFNQVDGDEHFFNTEREAVEYLKNLADDCYDEEWGWPSEIEECFIAKMIYSVKRVPKERPENYDGWADEFYDMEVMEIGE